jgi:hypothetical protein
MKNIIILTHGWTGSSVFAGLFGRAGFWLGDRTVIKRDYDTCENAELVDLNRRLLATLAPGLDLEHRYDPIDVARIARAASTLDLRPYREFVARCDARGPWVWKDPRLTWTIRIWERVLDLEKVTGLVLVRDERQAWITANNRRHIQSRGFTRLYNNGITASNHQFLDEHQIPKLEVTFEDLLLHPKATLILINTVFGTQLAIEDLQAVYRRPLLRPSRGALDHAKALLIYLKNYRERDGRLRKQPARTSAAEYPGHGNQEQPGT